MNRPREQLRWLLFVRHAPRWLLSRIGISLRLLWALPNTLLGLLIGSIGLVTGAQVRRVGRTLEFCGGAVTRFLEHGPLGKSILAMTLGHVILGVTPSALEIARRHELVHVRQYECWGPFFLPAYAASSLWMWWTGRAAYRENWFERQAYDQEEL